jgi:superfamily II DNA or RNA helicase
LEDLIKISKEISEEVEQYRHCEYQAAIAASVLSNDSKFRIVVAPTGSGKTWMQGLIAKYYCMNGESVTIIEPNETLRC